MINEKQNPIETNNHEKFDLINPQSNLTDTENFHLIFQQMKAMQQENQKEMKAMRQENQEANQKLEEKIEKQSKENKELTTKVVTLTKKTEELQKELTLVKKDNQELKQLVEQKDQTIIWLKKDNRKKDKEIKRYYDEFAFQNDQIRKQEVKEKQQKATAIQLQATIERKDQELQATIERKDQELQATIERKDQELQNKEHQLNLLLQPVNVKKNTKNTKPQPEGTTFFEVVGILTTTVVAVTGVILTVACVVKDTAVAVVEAVEPIATDIVELSK